MNYRDKTLWMISLIEKSGSLNAMKDFFAQLSHVREVDGFALINSISSESTDNLIHKSILIEPWMHKVSLKDIRNIVVFVLWKEFKVMLDSNEEYVDDSIRDSLYLKIKDRAADANEKLLVILETAYYINQIYIIRNGEEIPYTWDLFPNYINYMYQSKGLKETLHSLFLLYKSLITGNNF